MSRPTSRPEATAAAIQARADKGRAWQEIQELWEQGVRARAEYRAHPIVTHSYPCMTCTGFAYGRNGHCLDCAKEGVAEVAAGSRIRYEVLRGRKAKEWGR